MVALLLVICLAYFCDYYDYSSLVFITVFVTDGGTQIDSEFVFICWEI